MHLEDTVLKQLICSQCLKFLSVPPIKVYPDTRIRCGKVYLQYRSFVLVNVSPRALGRCTKAGDGGVESQLYNMIIKDTIFPCVNSYDGCPEMRSINTMSAHEQMCRTEEYSCQLCSTFEGSACSLYFHCENNHPTQTLHNSQFLVDVDQGSRDICYFYSLDRKLFFIFGNYDSARCEIKINLAYFGNHFNGDMKYTVRLSTIKGTVIYGSNHYHCSIMHRKMAETIKFSVDSSKFPKNILICTFDIHEKPALIYKETPTIIDPSSGYYLIKCPFHGLVDAFNDEKEDEELRVDFPAFFYFMGMIWRVFVKRKRSLIDLKRKLILYLQWDNTFPDNDPVENCMVSVVFGIVSDIASQTINKTAEDINLTIGKKCSASVEDWNVIANPTMGFLKDGVINVEILLKIHSCHKRVVKCEDCNRPCVYC